MRPTVTASALSRWDAISRSRPTAICHFQQFYNALRARCGDPVQPAGQVTKVFAFQFGGYPFAMRATLSPGREAGAVGTLETTVFNGATSKLVNLRPPDANFNACWLPLDLRDAWRGAAKYARDHGGSGLRDIGMTRAEYDENGHDYMKEHRWASPFYRP